MTQESTESRRAARERRLAENGYRASRRDERSKDSASWLKLAAAVAASVIMLVVAVDVIASLGRVHPGVTVAGVKVGGMKPSQASAELEKALPAKAAKPVTVVYGKKTWEISASDISLSYDYAGLSQNAMAVGREGGFGTIVSRRAGAWFGKESLPASALADPAKLNKALDEVAKTTNVAPKDAAVEIDGGIARVTESANGIELKRDELSRAILAAFTSDNRSLLTPVRTALPRISNATAEKAKATATSMMAEPVTVTYVGKQWTFSEKDIGKLIVFESIEPTGAAAHGGSSPWRLDPVVTQEEAEKIVAPKLGASVGTPAKDARFKTSKGAVTIVPSQNGVGADMAMLARDMTETLRESRGTSRTVEVKTTVLEPKLTTEKARGMGIVQRISTFTTTYDGSNTPRVNNIHTLGNALDGKLIAPGATFSFNGLVGERTAAKGYQEAPAIVKGKLVPQLGGGICQVGTTVFNAAFFAGVPIVSRENHSFYISHYPKGRDATVSWGGPDLKWKNDTKNWIMVSVAYTEDSITVSLYGTDPGYHVEYTTGPFTDEKPFPTEKVKDPTLKVGKKVVEDEGITGRKCVVERVVTKDGQVVRKDTFTSNYKPKAEVVRIGTKGSTTPTATVTP